MENKEEELYLCQLFGQDCRFVIFLNNTGRPVKLSSELRIVNNSNMKWMSSVTILPFSSYTWRFLGESSDSVMSVLLPDPYTVAFANQYRWSVSYLDTEETEPILIGNKMNSIELKELQEIPPNGSKIVPIQTFSKEPTRLTNLVLDNLTRMNSLSDFQQLEIPEALKSKLSTLFSDYEDLRTSLPSCPRCNEIHELC
jgi:hypothetical protein